ncbi:MAG: hypothetical protein K9N05_01975 [Candidatus Marinimicrobia bacterium]|nr:hypothetical protein [Candidatus Neomarinimicrobiota bacterium]
MNVKKPHLIILVLLFYSSLFAVINDSVNDYTEKMLPQSFGGATTSYFVFMGTSLSLTANSTSTSNTTTFTINGDNYRAGGTVAIPSSGDDRYYVIFVPKGNNSAAITLEGSNDWTTQTHTEISLPYAQTATTSAFYMTTTTAKVDSVVSSGLDLLLINNADYTNETVTTLPARQDNKYYIYYGSPASGSPSLKVSPYTPELNLKLFIEGSLW